MWGQSEIHLAIRKEGIKTKQAKRERERWDGEEATARLEGDREQGGRTGKGPGHSSTVSRVGRASSVPLAEHPQGCDLLLLTGTLSAQRVRRIQFLNY